MSQPRSQQKNVATDTRLRRLPSVSALLEMRDASVLVERYGRVALTHAIRAVIAEARNSLREDAAEPPDACTLLERATALLEREEHTSLQPVFNLTGTILHTNLGRALLAEAAISAAVASMRDSVTLEYDLEQGSRGERDEHVRALLCELTDAEDAAVVNNNAAAVLLCLNSLALGREAIVSRGELIEIGGTFRMPEIMARAGATMVEVGTTNRTHIRDYRDALNAHSAVILKVHTSNYRIQGFTAEVTAAELAVLARESGVPLMHDLGSGNLIDLSRYGLKSEQTVREAVVQGAQLVSFSGDKLLGGPQAGIIVGDRALIERIRQNPLRRALRIDKIRLAALEATLKIYRNPERLVERLPTVKFLSRTRSEIEIQARQLRAAVGKALGDGFSVELCDCSSEVGSGALPLETLPSAGLAIRARIGSASGAVEGLARALRRLSRPIIGRIHEGRLLLDLRCLADADGLLKSLAELPSAWTAQPPNQ